MRLGRWSTFACLAAVLVAVGCAKGTAVEGSLTSFGPSSASAGPSSATNASDTGDDATTDGMTSSAEVGGENCGNGVVDPPEECDGPDLGQQSCTAQGYSGGELSCAANCVFDTSMCSDACGNGSIDAGEDCDGAELGDADCTTAGFAGGTIACNADCTFDTSGCADAECGDGMLQDGESCDCGNPAGKCTPAQLDNQTCTSLPGGGFSGGVLGCVPSTCTFDSAACTACGNGAIDPGEACDSADLAGQTCQSQGFDAGTLACSPMCTFNTGGCLDYVCGNGACDPNEDTCACPSDCPNDPNSCDSPCECQNFGGACWCDDACVGFGDCCPNGPC
jgi:hypothetical protein